jgi:hypothetical protein
VGTVQRYEHSVLLEVSVQSSAKRGTRLYSQNSFGIVKEWHLKRWDSTGPLCNEWPREPAPAKAQYCFGARPESLTARLVKFFRGKVMSR